jgi:uncharacterized membrane protein HdeD (DUF308 family)
MPSPEPQEAPTMSFTQIPDGPAFNPEAPAAVRRWMHDHWGVFLAEGIVLDLLGLAAIALPPLAGLASTLILGWILIVAGIAGLLSTSRSRQAPGFGWSLLSAAAALIAGLLLVWNPLAGLVTLTYVLAAYFLVDGVVAVVMALAHRREFSGRWEWMLLNGIIDLILAAIILSGMPGDVAWVLGLLVGIDLVFGGMSLIMMALASRKSGAALI